MHKLLIAAILLGGPAVASADPEPALTFETPTVGGSLAPDAVTKVVKRIAGKLRRCYAKQAVLPVVQTTATARFTVSVTGKVAASAVSGLPDEAAQACMAAAIAKLKFGKPRDRKPVEVSAPLVFDPASTGGAFAALIGTGDSGFDDTNIYGGLLGNEAGDLDGAVGGLGVPGGGGTGWGQIGTGRYKGLGTTSQAPRIAIAQPVVTGPGELDKAIIRRYVKRNVNKLRYCYEKELLATPTLHGTVTTEFGIDVDGNVGSVKASGTKNPALESCVATVIKAIEFPRPKRGEITVTYPLTFKLPDAP